MYNVNMSYYILYEYVKINSTCLIYKFTYQLTLKLIFCTRRYLRVSTLLVTMIYHVCQLIQLCKLSKSFNWFVNYDQVELLIHIQYLLHTQNRLELLVNLMLNCNLTCTCIIIITVISIFLNIKQFHHKSS